MIDHRVRRVRRQRGGQRRGGRGGQKRGPRHAGPESGVGRAQRQAGRERRASAAGHCGRDGRPGTRGRAGHVLSPRIALQWRGPNDPTHLTVNNYYCTRTLHVRMRRGAVDVSRRRSSRARHTYTHSLDFSTRWLGKRNLKIILSYDDVLLLLLLLS